MTVVEDAIDDFGSIDDLGVNFPKSVRPSVTYVTEGGVTDTELDAVKGNTEISAAISEWMRNLGAAANTSWDLFNRRQYRTTDNVFRQFAMCEKAVEQDDILSTTADVTERVAIDKVVFEMFDEDQQDLWEQLADEIDLDGKVKSIFRELFKFSNCYVGVLWDNAIIQVRTKPDPNDIAPPLTGPGEEVDPLNPPNPIPIPAPVPTRKGNRQRKKKFAVTVPSALTVFDVCKILPVGQLMFGRERFAYIADPGETSAFGQVLAGDMVDDLVLRLIERKYQPTRVEEQLCGALGIDPNALWLLKKDACFRVNDTRADYERWAVPRLKGCFEVLELKEHLRASDRATLIGSTNFIVLITKGSDKHPARPRELENLGEQARVVARMPILVGDHRLDVKIVTPATDHTLDSSRWDTLDERLLFRALETFALQKGSGARGSTQTTSSVIARGLESRRDQVTQALMRKLFRAVLDRNPTALDEMPNLHCAPRRVTLDINADLINAIVAIRDRGDISRETTLEELGYDQDTEAMRRAREKNRYDAQFQSIVPHASPAATPYGTNPAANTDNPHSNGQQGGRPRGGAGGGTPAAPAKKTAAKTAPAKKTAAKKTAPAKKTAASSRASSDSAEEDPFSRPATQHAFEHPGSEPTEEELEHFEASQADEEGDID